MTREKEDKLEPDYERGEAVLSIFKRGAEFTRQILLENESLRSQLQEVTDRQHVAA